MTEQVVHFFQKQHFVIVSTIDKQGSLHNSCKGIIKVNQKGRVYLLDLYRGKTFANLKRNPHISITAVDEHHFRGYCLKGKAKIIKRDKLSLSVSRVWEKKIVGRITHRLLKNIRGEKGHHLQPEALMPQPTYLIVMEVKQVIDLTPHHLR